MARYDEDLHENLFFQTLIGKYNNLFQEAANQRFMVCVPRCDTVFRLKLDRKDFENHILRPYKPESHSNTFISLNNKLAVIEGDMVKVGQGYKEARSVKILFDECFFNSREESYQVFCLEQPMEGAMGDDIMISLRNLEECNKFLWGEPGGEKVRRSVDRLTEMFQVERGTMRPIIDAALAVYTRAVQEVFKIRKFHAAVQKNFCKLAVETYVMASLHKKIFREVCFTVAAKDAALNKVTRNLSDSNPQSLGIKSEFRLLLPKACAVLAQLNQFTTPLEKLYCFSHTITALTSGSGTTHDVVTADELLPILVYLVIVTDIPNWNGNLTYINRFHFSNVTYEEFTYYLTSFEAAVEYVHSENVQLTSRHTPAPVRGPSVPLRLRSNSGTMTEETKQFFQLVSEGNEEQLREILRKAEVEKASYKALFCHPLCDCSKCMQLLDKQLDDSSRTSVFLRDPNGRTGLHLAALLGHNEMVRLLIEYGSIVMATDHNGSTPLHLSCLKGHQKCTLLLLNEGSNINAVDNHLNTPLHQACSNGHEECVKALLFHSTQCQVNVANEQGDTPLHNAARWGYASIVSELLRMGAYYHQQNRRREVPYQCAQNRKVQELLTEAHRKHMQKQQGETGGMAGGVVGGMADMVGEQDSPPVVIRSRRMSKRISARDSMRESISETDRQLKRLFRAIQDGDTNLVRYIFGWEEGSSPKMSAEDLCHPLCQCDRCSKLRKSMSRSVLSVDCTDMLGHTPLHKACLVGQRGLVELFLRHGALLDSRTKENDQTPLHLACQYNQKDVVVTLLEYQPTIDPQDSLGNTPLHLACNNGHMETAALLLMYGADVTISNNRGDTPLHNAARWNHPELVSELLLYGARYTATNNNNRTPGDLTSDENVKDLIWKAGHGIIAVGSYSPLNRATPNETMGSPVGSGRGLGSSGGSSSSGGKNSYFLKLDKKKVKQDQGFASNGSGSHDQTAISPDHRSDQTVISPDRKSGSHDQTAISPDHRSGSHARVTTSPDHTSGSCDQTTTSPSRLSGSHDQVTTSPDHRSGSHAQATTSPSRLSGSPDRITTSSDHRSGSRDRISASPEVIEEEAGPEAHDYVVIEDPVEHRPLGTQQGAEVNFVGQGSSDELFSRGQVGDEQRGPHPQGEGLLQQAEPSQKSEISLPAGEEPKIKPHPMRGDDKLRNLLLSIENFDRSTLNRRDLRKNRLNSNDNPSSPSFPQEAPPPLDTTPSFPSHSPQETPPPVSIPAYPTLPHEVHPPVSTPPYSPNYFPLPAEEEMQTVGGRGTTPVVSEQSTPYPPQMM